MIQPNLRLVDARGMDGARLIRQCRDHGANAVLLNAGGIVAWYPTAQPWHWRNPLLARDFVGEATAEARRLGVRVLLRMDWSCLLPAIARRHRNWLALDVAGRPQIEWRRTAHPLWRTCPERPYWRRHAFRALEELMARYPFDGFFFNAWDRPDCRCPECTAACRKALGAVPGRGVPWTTAFGRAWRRWRGERTAAFTRDLNARIKRFSPGTLLTVDFHLTNDHPHHLAGAAWDGAGLADAVDMVTVEAFNFLNRPRPHWRFWAEEEARMIRSFPAGKPGIVLLSGSERWIGRRVVQAPEVTAEGIRQIVSHGAIPCVAVSGDFRQDDTRVWPVTGRIFRALVRRPPPRHPPSTRARIALVYGQRTMDAYGGDRCRDKALAHYRGWYEALRETGAVFTVVHDGVLPEFLSTRPRLTTLILPNVACLSGAACRVVDGWVSGGGRLVAEFETSRCDERGRQRARFGLRCLGRRPGRMVTFPGTWFDAAGPGRRWVGGHTRIHPVAGEFLLTRGSRRDAVLALLDWTFNNKPEWSRPERSTGQHGIYLSRFGRGRVRYLPWSPGALYHQQGSPEHRDLIARLIAR